MREVYTARISDFLMIFIGILVESLPFVVIGVIISALVGVYIKSSWILKYKSKNRFISHIQSMFIGFFLPVCECGNIPLAKRLLIVGFKPSEVITFMLAAPIINPLVWITTAEAFNLDKNIAWIRIISGGCIALAVGLFFSYQGNSQDMLVSDGSTNKLNRFLGFSKTVSQSTSPYFEEDITHGSAFVEIFRTEFFTVFKMLLLGCFLAASFQMFIPRSVILVFGSDPNLSVLALMFLAFIVSMCSTVDAFFALALASSFSLGSIVSFLVFGPMIDVKTLSMLRSVFTTKALISVSIIVALCCIILGFGTNYFYKFNY
jgi:uncharacterized protein